MPVSGPCWIMPNGRLAPTIGKPAPRVPDSGLTYVVRSRLSLGVAAEAAPAKPAGGSATIKAPAGEKRVRTGTTASAAGAGDMPPGAARRRRGAPPTLAPAPRPR